MKILVSRHFHDPIQNYTEIDDVDIPFHSILDQDICFVSTSVQEFFFWMLVLLEFHPSRLPCTASCCFAFPVQSPCKHG